MALRVLAAACALAASPGLRAADEPLRIGTITITVHDVYTTEEAARGRGYALVNSLHVRTRETVIRRLLIVREGEPFNPARLAECERNLRALSFLQSASVTAGEPHDGVVDVAVVTQDSWSTEPGGSYGSSGGDTRFSFEIRETNFLGRGKELSVLFEDEIDRKSQGLSYGDPLMFGRYWRGDVAYVESSDGHQATFAVQRPFYAFAVPWSFHGLADDRVLESRIYRDAVIYSEFGQDHDAFAVGYGRAFAVNDARAHRLTLGLEWVRDRFTALDDGTTTILPEDREFRYLVADYEYAQNRFQKLNFVDRDLRYQDFRLGTQWTLRAGVSPEALGVETTTGLLASSLAHGWGLTPTSLLLGRVGWESRIGAERRNEVLAADLRYVLRTGREHPRTLVARIGARAGRDLDADKQFFADGDTGLRAYRLHAFEGDSSLLINVEQRFFLGRELWQVISPGLAVFVDAGNAADGSAAFDPGNLHFDAGAGLRIGAARTPKNLFRLDFAYAFDADPLGRSGWLVSFSGSQAF